MYSSQPPPPTRSNSHAFFLTLSTICALKIMIQQVSGQPCSVSNPITLDDTLDAREQFSCSSSTPDMIYVNYTPTRTFHGHIELRFQYDYETLPADVQNPISFCFQSSSECDYIAEMALLRNLFLEGDFTSGSQTTLLIKSGSITPLIMLSFYINDGTKKCLNNDTSYQCGGNGNCIVFETERQCSCQNDHAGRGCEISAQALWQNSQFLITVPAQKSRIVAFTLSDSTVKSIFTSNQLNFVTTGDSNTKCSLSVVLSDSQLEDRFIYWFKDGSLNLNDLFTGDSTNSKKTSFSQTKIFSLLVFIDNSQSNVKQNAGIELQITKLTKEDETTEYIVYFLVGFIGLLIVIIFFGCLYMIFKRRMLAMNSRQHCELAQLNFIEKKKPRPVRETEKSFFAILNEKVPVKLMTGALLRQLKAESGIASYESIKKQQQQNQNEQQQQQQQPEQQFSSTKSEDVQHNGVCSICIMTIDVGNNYRKTLCHHYFHAECLEAWMKKQRSCPMCRFGHEIPDLEASNQKQIESHQINGQKLSFEMFVNPVCDNKPTTRKALRDPLITQSETDRQLTSFVPSHSNNNNNI